MELMKILAQNWRDIKNPEAGGAESYFHEIAKWLVKKGHDVTLVSSRYRDCKNSEIIDGIKIIRIGNKFLFNFLFFWYYITIFRKQKFDLFIDNCSKIPLCTPFYVTIPIIAIIYHIHGKSMFEELPFLLALYAYLIEKCTVFYRNVKIVTISESTKKELVEKFRIPPYNIYIIPPGIDISPSLGEKSKIPLVLYFGRVKKYKRIEHILQAFKHIEKNHSAKLIIAGKGDNYPTLKTLAKTLKIKNIEFKGELSETEKVTLLKKAWIYINTSSKEGWGISVIEANACGTPCIAYNVPGLRDSIKHGYNGLLVTNGKTLALTSTIERLLSDDHVRERLTKNSLEWAKKFNWNRTAEKFERFLARVYKKLQNVHEIILL